MKGLGTTVFLALSIVAATTLAGCEGLRAKPGVDGTAYSLGHLDAMANATPKRVVEAAKSVLEEMEVFVEATASGVDGRVLGKTALGKRIEITVQRQDAGGSKYSVVVRCF